LVFTNDLSLVSHVPAGKKAVILLSTQRDYNTSMGEEKDHKPEFIMHSNATASGFDVQDKLVREDSCMKSTRHWCLKLFFSLTDVACVNAAKEESLKMSASFFSGRRNGKTTHKKKG